MPTAESFNALGAGNGFTSCLPKLNVSTYNFVAELTLTQAVKIYWMWYGVTCDVSDEETSVSGVSFLTDNPNWQPKDVACDDDRRATETDTDLVSARESFIKMATPNPVRYYNGDVEIEANFIGYGVTGVDFNLLFRFFTDFGDIEYYYFSHLAPDEEQYWDTVDAVTISGIPLIRTTFSGVFPGNVGPVTLDFFDPPA